MEMWRLGFFCGLLVFYEGLAATQLADWTVTWLKRGWVPLHRPLSLWRSGIQSLIKHLGKSFLQQSGRKQREKTGKCLKRWIVYIVTRWREGRKEKGWTSKERKEEYCRGGEGKEDRTSREGESEDISADSLKLWGFVFELWGELI